MSIYISYLCLFNNYPLVLEYFVYLKSTNYFHYIFNDFILIKKNMALGQLFIFLFLFNFFFLPIRGYFYGIIINLSNEV